MADDFKHLMPDMPMDMMAMPDEAVRRQLGARKMAQRFLPSDADLAELAGGKQPQPAQAKNDVLEARRNILRRLRGQK
jgi:hypothetical protein